MLAQNNSKRESCGVTKWHDKGYYGQGITVAVLDSHPYIAEHMDREIFSAPLGEYTERTHATNVAAVVHEVAPKAKIVLLPFMTAQRTESLEWIRNNKVDLINVSLKIATTSSESKQLMDDLGALNIPVIAAAGNDGEDVTRVAAPARYDWSIAVGGFVENTSQVYYENSSGEEMDCVAYTNINLEFKPGYINPFPGTSAAAPWLTGMLACWFSNQKVPSVDKLLKVIKDNCIDVGDPGKDVRSGYGLFVLPDTLYVPETKIVLTIGKDTTIVNGVEVKMDTTPVVNAGRVLVPVRFVSENLGCTVSYNATTKEITIVDGDGKQIVLTVGSNIAVVNGDKVTLDVTPLVTNGRVLVPVRFVSENLGCTVNYNATTQEITIVKL